MGAGFVDRLVVVLDPAGSWFRLHHSRFHHRQLIFILDYLLKPLGGGGMDTQIGCQEFRLLVHFGQPEQPEPTSLLCYSKLGSREDLSAVTIFPWRA